MTDTTTATRLPTLAQVRAAHHISIRRLSLSTVPRVHPSSISMIETTGVSYPEWRSRIANALGLDESSIDWSRK